MSFVAAEIPSVTPTPFSLPTPTAIPTPPALAMIWDVSVARSSTAPELLVSVAPFWA